jgi:hypothetical protein
VIKGQADEIARRVQYIELTMRKFSKEFIGLSIPHAKDFSSSQRHIEIIEKIENPLRKRFILVIFF